MYHCYALTDPENQILYLGIVRGMEPPLKRLEYQAFNEGQVQCARFSQERNQAIRQVWRRGENVAARVLFAHPDREQVRAFRNRLIVQLEAEGRAQFLTNRLENRGRKSSYGTKDYALKWQRREAELGQLG